jgi:hypothetical protein
LLAGFLKLTTTPFFFLATLAPQYEPVQKKMQKEEKFTPRPSIAPFSFLIGYIKRLMLPSSFRCV